MRNSLVVDRDTAPMIAFTIIAFVVVVLGAHYLLKPREYRVAILDRYWTQYTNVNYDYYDCGYTLGPDGDLQQDCGWETATRCTTSASGRELPVVPPDPGCAMKRGDYLTHPLYTTIIYRLEDNKDKTEHRLNVHNNDWERLAPDTYRTIYINKMGIYLYAKSE